MDAINRRSRDALFGHAHVIKNQKTRFALFRTPGALAVMLTQPLFHRLRDLQLQDCRSAILECFPFARLAGLINDHPKTSMR